jgi:A/G-specific adenine glycosylase
MGADPAPGDGGDRGGAVTARVASPFRAMGMRTAPRLLRGPRQGARTQAPHRAEARCHGGIALPGDGYAGGAPAAPGPEAGRRRTQAPHRAEARCHQLTHTISRWFAEARRDLPWRRAVRGGRRDPYRSLVSEAMLQQTQVARVVERFGPFLERFPTAEALAAADEQDVLAAWTGLGYYRRARLLHAAAKAIVTEHAGRLPRDVEALRRLPGVGRYTAGAIASICFGEAAPIVDGNVARVLLRIEGREGTPGERETDAWLWERAGDLVAKAAAGAGGPGPFNEGLMELGATVCLPRAPRCGACPVAGLCKARAAGTQERIPAPRQAAERQVIRCAAVVVADSRGRVLVDRRPSGEAGGGLWAGMWQAPTLEIPGEGRGPGRARIERWLGEPLAPGRAGEQFTFLATHRRLEFGAWRAAPLEAGVARRLVRQAEARGAAASRWVSRRELAQLAMSSPQRRLLGVL